MQVPSARRRQLLLAEAFEQGIRHFDVARMYGLGAAEGELGKFARGRRDELVIATKFGIAPAGAAGRLARAQAPARAALARFPALKNAVKRRANALHQPHRYDAATAHASLEISLRELGTEYVDVLLVHGPTMEDVLDLTELGEMLAELRDAGRIRAWGFAGDLDPCLRLSNEASAATILQIRDDILEPIPPEPNSSSSVITFGVISGALRRILDHVTSSARHRARWAAAIGADCEDSEVVASLLVQDALGRNRGGTVLFSTTRPDRIRVATRAARECMGEPEPTPLRALRELVRSELNPAVTLSA